MPKHLFFTLYLLSVSIYAVGQTESDRKAVEKAVLNYVEGIYEMNPDKIREGVHPELSKRGFWRDKKTGKIDELKMTFPELVEFVKDYNSENWLPKNAPKKVEILDIQDKTAALKLTAHWGYDYCHLAKYDNKWLIVGIIWQSYPAGFDPYKTVKK